MIKMGNKYEVFYWDFNKKIEVVEKYTASLLKAFFLVRKLEKQWYCVGIRFRRDRVRKDGT